MHARANGLHAACVVVGSLAWPAVGAAGDLAALSWLSGCWANARGDAGSGEYWQPLAGGTMLGIGRLVRDGRTVDYEFLRLHENEQGQVVYTAIPARQKETPFVASRIGPAEATFENPSHDFPQKITYTREGDTAMQVRIEGTRQGKARVIDFRFTRVACEK